MKKWFEIKRFNKRFQATLDRVIRKEEVHRSSLWEEVGVGIPVSNHKYLQSSISIVSHNRFTEEEVESQCQIINISKALIRLPRTRGSQKFALGRRRRTEMQSSRASSPIEAAAMMMWASMEC
ncbi:hypothetical protein RRG08_027772 [Elysia crispata]|uniref:Uncharacterized protein n=1 Tax=Elysia crispata TaxID=231223 RepID=A0AAE0ZAL6_9GAST|nr:hypothetical protein RRG08_027772 [Elysia crispata]